MKKAVLHPNSEYQANQITSPKLIVDSDKFIELYNAAANIINFCYDEGKGWIGTETIRKSGAFVKLVSELHDAIEPFIPDVPGDDVE